MLLLLLNAFEVNLPRCRVFFIFTFNSTGIHQKSYCNEEKGGETRQPSRKKHSHSADMSQTRGIIIMPCLVSILHEVRAQMLQKVIANAHLKGREQ